MDRYGDWRLPNSADTHGTVFVADVGGSDGHVCIAGDFVKDEILDSLRVGSRQNDEEFPEQSEHSVVDAPFEEIQYEFFIADDYKLSIVLLLWVGAVSVQDAYGERNHCEENGREDQESSSSWSTSEREASPLIEAVFRLHLPFAREDGEQYSQRAMEAAELTLSLVLTPSTARIICSRYSVAAKEKKLDLHFVSVNFDSEL